MKQMNEEPKMDDTLWRTKNSLWMVWPFIPLCNFLAFLWIGFRAKAAKWVLAGVVYFVAGASCMAELVGGVNWLSLTGWVKVALLVAALVLLYFVGILHAFLCRAEYLRRYAAVLEKSNDAEIKARVRREFMGDAADKQMDDSSPQKLVLEAGYRMQTEMYKLYQEMPDARLKDEMAEIYQTADKIYKYVAKNPDSASKLRKFNEYYFPEVLKTLRSYQELMRLGESGDIGERIEKLLQTMVITFRNQLDNLTYDKTLDIRTDIAVLEQMAQRDGLTKENEGKE